MQRITSISNSVAGHAAVAAGSLFAAAGVVQIVHSQRNTGSKVDGLAGHLNLGFSLTALILMAPVFIALARYARSTLATKAAVLAAAGTALLGVTCISSLVNGQDYSFFNVVAPVTNGSWLLGSIVLAVSLKRAGQVPAAVAIGLPFVWVAAIPLATLGGGLIAGAYLMVVGYLLVNAAIAVRTRAATEALGA